MAATALALACTLVLTGCDLGFSLGFGGKSDGHFEGSELTVPVLYVSGGKGGVASQRITAEAADGGDLRIDITENDVSGVAPVTQSATWTAVTAATLLTGARPDTAYTFGFDARINTPAAGAVTAVGVLALYYGTEVQPGVALAGGVTPFGTVSPVAGLPEQVSAAIEAGGIDTILVPAGQRIAADADGRPVDLDQVAATGGMTITEVADVASAYAIMTGEELPEAVFPTPAASPTPLPTATGGPAEAETGAFAAAVDSALARADASLGAAIDASLAERSRVAGDRARALRETGEGSGAFAAAASAADLAAVAAADSVDSAAVDATRAAAEQILMDAARDAPDTLDVADVSLEVLGAAADAYALAAYAQTALADGEEAGPPAAALAQSSLARAQEGVDLRDALGTGAGALSRDADLDGLGSLLRRAAIAATDAYVSRAGEAPVRAGDLPAVRLAAFDAAREDLEAFAADDAWLGLALATTSFSRTVPPLVAQQSVRVPDGVDPTAAVRQRIAVGDEYAVRAVDALADAGADVALVRGALADATATATAAPAPGASAVYATPFLRARVLAFAAGVERE
ncbi:archaeal serine protease [Microbacterium testaceum StLB037]|uniref:Archaeal serine protease n=1 Tax=Microbacterium testaceum (strain StLB037) TaxID=979556 RepID=E8NFY6_MICTS|nr:archaeal serine protease [Microbacterium testaceum StLB037]